MTQDLQKASLFKRIFAGLFDGMIVVIIAIAIATLLTSVLGFEEQTRQLDGFYTKYETQFNTSLSYTAEEYEALSEQEKANLDAAYEALNADEEAVQLFNMLIHMILLTVTGSLLAATLLVELLMPLLLKNGQTLGKKTFGICLMRTDGVKVSAMQVFVRTVLGKFAVETMIPVYIGVRLLWGGGIDLVSLILVMALAIAQVISIFATRTNSLLHDLMAGTVAVDYASQQIFGSQQELIEHQKREAAERAAREIY